MEQNTCVRNVLQIWEDALTLVIFALKGIYRRIFYGNQHEKSDEKISQKYD